MAPPRRDDIELMPERTPDEKRAYRDGYRLGRHRGRIDAWQEWTGHKIPGSDVPNPYPPDGDDGLIGWPDVWAAIRRQVTKITRGGR